MKYFFLISTFLFSQHKIGFIYDIKQTVNSDIIIAAKEGFYKYDGYRLTKFLSQNISELNGKRSQSFLELEDKKYLLGSSGGLYFLDDNQISLIAKYSVNDLYKVSKTEIIFVSYSGLFVYDLEKKSIKTKIFNGIYIEKIRASKKYYYTVGRNGLYKISKDFQEITNLIPEDTKDHNIFFRSLELDEFGNTWAGSMNSRIFKYHETMKFAKEVFYLGDIPLKNFGIIFDLYYSQIEKSLYVSSYIKYKLKYDLIKSEASFIDTIDTRESVITYRDKGANLYFGTTSGLKILKNSKPLFTYHYTGRDINSISGNNKNILVGTKVEGLFLYEGNKKIDSLNNRIYPKLNNYIPKLNRLNNKYYIGSWDGLFLYENNRLKEINLPFKSEDNLISVIYKDTKSRIWIANPYSGIAVLDKNHQILKTLNTKSQPIALQSNTVSQVLEDRKGNFWLATLHKGLSYYKESVDSLIIYDSDHSESGTSHPVINDLVQDSSGGLWIAYEKNALSYYDGKKFKHYDKDFKFSDAILSLTIDEDNDLWFSGENGLYIFKNKEFTKIPYNHRFGKFNYNAFYKDDYQNYYYGLSNGLIKFNPYEVKKKLFDYKFSLEPFYINGNEIKPVIHGEKLNFFTYFRKLSFKIKTSLFQNKSRYFYSINESIWQELEPKNFRYSNSHFNTFLFKIREIDENGFEKTFTIKIGPKVHIIYYIIFLLILVVLYMLRFFRNRKYLSQNNKSTDLPENRKHEIITLINNALENNEFYKDNTITIQSFSKKINISPRYVSLVINEKMNKTFRDLINEYRINAVINDFSKKENKDKSIIEIAGLCGFNSSSTFNTAFKKITGKNPSDYRTMVQKSF